MIDGFVKAVLHDVKQKYPHIGTPSILKAKITGRKKLEAYQKEVIIEWDGWERNCRMKDFYYSYNLKVISQSGEADTTYPGLPNVRCKEKYEVGEMVTVALLEGEVNPVIVAGG